MVGRKKCSRMAEIDKQEGTATEPEVPTGDYENTGEAAKRKVWGVESNASALGNFRSYTQLLLLLSVVPTTEARGFSVRSRVSWEIQHGLRSTD